MVVVLINISNEGNALTALFVIMAIFYNNSVPIGGSGHILESFTVMPVTSEKTFTVGHSIYGHT